MKKVLVITFCVLISSCSGIKKSPQPDVFLDTKKMAAVMTDIYLIEGSMTANRKSFVDLGVVPEMYVYEKHGIDSLSFKNNFNYYADRAEDFIGVLEIVNKNLLAIKDSISAKEQRIKDEVPQLKSVLDRNKLKDSIKSSIKNNYLEDNK